MKTARNPFGWVIQARIISEPTPEAKDEGIRCEMIETSSVPIGAMLVIDDWRFPENRNGDHPEYCH